MRLVWARQALEDREAIFDHIEDDNSRAAVKVDDHIVAALRRLLEFPESGRPGRIAGSRELATPRTPYVDAYDRGPDENSAYLAGRQMQPSKDTGGHAAD